MDKDEFEKRYTHISKIPVSYAASAARWWVNEREGWPLDRAVRIWLTYEEDVYWNPDSHEDAELYDNFCDAVMEEARQLPA